MTHWTDKLYWRKKGYSVIAEDFFQQAVMTLTELKLERLSHLNDRDSHARAGQQPEAFWISD